MRVYWVFLLCVAVVMGSAREVFADGDRVVLVHAGPGDAVVSHLLDELVALGLTVEIAPSGELDLSALGKGRKARAVLRVTPSRRGVELWVEGSDELVTMDPLPNEVSDRAALALRVVESLRGRLLAVQRTETTVKVEAPSVEKMEAPKEPVLPAVPVLPSVSGPLVQPFLLRPYEPRPEPAVRARRLSLRLDPAMLAHPRGGGISAAGTALLSARYAVYSRLSVEGLAFVPVMPATLSASAGRVQLATSAVLVGGFWDLLEPRSRFGVGVGAGVGAGLLTHYGQPTGSGIVARDGSVVSALPYLRLGFLYRALPSLGLSVDFLGAVATPRPVFRFPGQTTDIYYGQPLLGIGLGLEVPLL